MTLNDVFKYADEETVISQLRDGSREAFGVVYNRFHPGIFNYLLKITKDPGLTEDLVHDVFLKIWENRERLDSSLSFASYLYRIAKNTALTQLTRIATFDHIRDEMLHRIAVNINSHSVMNDIESKQYQELLGQAIASLPPQRRQAFILCREKGKSYDEAASELGISRNTLKQHLSLAVQSIRAYLLEHGNISLLFMIFFSKNI